MISKHIPDKEGVYSITALRLGIDNTPGDCEYLNMKIIAEKVFEPLRSYIGKPIKINSFYRSIDLNKAIGGSSRSQHCQGREFGNEDNPAWVHVSYVSEDQNRNRCLKAYKENGKTKYKVI